MKRITFFKCFKIDDAVQSGLQVFNKESGYPVSKNTNEGVLDYRYEISNKIMKRIKQQKKLATALQE